ncbi:MAG TPA: TfuA-related McrA-glycine thioamidation protein [Candidatus Acidoferrales bacterium]|nr:TfuA-related McrA-glycine thioamidation protein [Candidatus Acidoferrales bacterium]
MTEKNCIVFTGPSLSFDEVKLHDPDLTCYPPVSRGDIKRVVESGAEIIGIIDGVFYNKAAVSHKEILDALKLGVVVVGGSSMGALRAYELDVFGMIGVGKIYNCYKRGYIEADDEVALAFNPVTYEPVSVPLVNIRQALAALMVMKLLSVQQSDKLLKIAQNLFYPDRRFETIFKLALRDKVICKEDVETIETFIKMNDIDLKKQDAIAVVKEVIRIKDNKRI